MPWSLRSLLLFLVVAAGVATPWVLGPFPDGPGLRLGVVLAAGAAWAFLVASRASWARGPRALGWILIGAVLLRVLALAGAPGTSDDVHRYVWEGALVLDGVSPYAAAPASPEREDERRRWSEAARALNHPEVSAAYPPLTQAACALAVAAAGGTRALERPGGHARAVSALRFLFALCDLAALGALIALLRARGRPATDAVAWAWCPLVALESGGVPHFDALGVGLLLAALALDARGRWRLAAAFVGAGALVKWLPLAAVGFLREAEREAGLRARLVRSLPVGLLLGGVLGLGFAPLAWMEGGGRGLLGGLGEYAFRWESFSLVFRWIERPLRSEFALDESWSDPRRIARGLVLLVLAATALVLWLRHTEALRATALLLVLFLVLSPTLHPWYLLWGVPWLAFWRSRAGLWLVAVAPLTYWPLPRWRAEQVWVEPAWLWPVVALPFFAFAVLDLRRVWGASARGD